MGKLEVAGKSENPMTNRGSRRRVLRPYPGASGNGWP